jgi:S-adenosyl methyltransferase/ABC transporter
VWEALDLYASFYRRSADWNQLLETWGLASKRNALVSKLSGGQRQRLFIALALVGQPDLVFLDELTSGLDPQARRLTWDLVKQIRDSGVTVVLVSHFIDEAEELCDRVAIFDRGRISALDSPAALIDSTATTHRLLFRPVGELDELVLASLPGVTGVSREGGRPGHRDRERGLRERGDQRAGPQEGPRGRAADRGAQPRRGLCRADRAHARGLRRRHERVRKAGLRRNEAVPARADSGGGAARHPGRAGRRLRDDPGLIDFAEPVAVLFLSVLHFIGDEENPGQIVAGFRDRLPAGGYLVGLRDHVRERGS